MELKTFNTNHTVFHYINTKQFKTRVLTIRFLSNLNTVNPTSRHLMINMLKAKNQLTKTRKAQSKALESLYDAILYVSASKFGTEHVLQLTIAFIDDRYTIEKDLIDRAFAFVSTTLKKPLFDEVTLEEEKQFLKDYFKAEYTNKNRYAHKQYIKHLYQEYPYNKHALGDEDAVDLITLSDIEASYDEMLNESRIFISFLSDLEPSLAHQKLTNSIDLKSLQGSFSPLYKHSFRSLEPVKETLEVTQNRLFITLKTNTFIKDDDYFANIVLNALLGDGSDSLLFKSVREEASLAYYVYSSYSPFTGLITVTSGMDKLNIEQGKKLIFDVLKRIQSNDFTDEELELAKLQLFTAIKQSYDHPMSLSLKALRSSLFDIPFTEEYYLAEIGNVDRQSIVRLSQQLTPIFSYELGGPYEND